MGKNFTGLQYQPLSHHQQFAGPKRQEFDSNAVRGVVQLWQEFIFILGVEALCPRNRDRLSHIKNVPVLRILFGKTTHW